MPSLPSPPGWDENGSLATLGGWNPDPNTWGPIYDQAVKQYPNVPKILLQALVQTESGGRAASTSSAGAQGPAQIMPSNKPWLGIGNQSSYDPRVAIPAAAKYLNTVYEKGGGWSQALREYAGGPNQSKWGPDVAAYVPKVMANYKALGGDPGGLGYFSSDPAASSGYSTSIVAQSPRLPPGMNLNDPNSVAALQHDITAQVQRAGHTPTLSDYTTAGIPAPPGTPAEEGKGGAAAPVPSATPGASLLGPPDPSISAEPQGAQPPTVPSAEPLQTGQQPVSPPPALPGPIPSVVPKANAQPVTGGGAGASGTTVAPPTGASWGPMQSFASGAVLGYGPEVSAAAQAAKYAAQTGNTGAMPDVYSQALEQYRNAQAQWEAKNPTQSTILPTAGAIPSLMAGTSLAGGVVRGGINTLGRALPEVAAGAGRVADFMSGGGGSNAFSQWLSNTLGGAAQGGFQGWLGSHMSNDPVMRQIPVGAIAGGAFGGTLGHLINAAVVKPFNATVVRPIAELMDQYRRLLGPEAESAAPRAGQITQSGTLKRLDKAYGGGEDQAGPFTRLMSRTMGGNTDAMTKETFGRLRDRIGQTLDAVAQRTGILISRPFVNGLNQVRSDAAGRLSLPAEVPQLDQINRVLDSIDGEIVKAPQRINRPLTLNGETYQRITQRGSYLDDMVRSSDPVLRQYGVRIRGLIDDAMERGSPPDAVAALRQARQMWKNSVALEDLVEKSASGVLNPRSVQGQLRKVYGDYGWNPPGDVRVLGDIGQLLPSIDATGGQVVRNKVETMLQKLGHPAMIGGATLLAEGHLPKTGAALLGAGLASSGYEHAIRSTLQANWLREHLVDMALGREGPLRSGTDVLANAVGLRGQQIPSATIPFITQMENRNPGAPR